MAAFCTLRRHILLEDRLGAHPTVGPSFAPRSRIFTGRMAFVAGLWAVFFHEFSTETRVAMARTGKEFAIATTVFTGAAFGSIDRGDGCRS